MKKKDILDIEWIDCLIIDDQIRRVDVPSELTFFRTVGVLIKETEEYVIVARDADGKYIRGMAMIPKIQIKKMRKI